MQFCSWWPKGSPRSTALCVLHNVDVVIHGHPGSSTIAQPQSLRLKARTDRTIWTGPRRPDGNRVESAL